MQPISIIMLRTSTFDDQRSVTSSGETSRKELSPWALVTGASSGIGLCYATTLARDYGYNIILVSNQPNELTQAADMISHSFSVHTQCLCLDLAEQDAAERVHRFCIEHNLDVQVLINNAGMLIFERLTQVPTKRLNTMLMLHVVTLTHLTQLFAQDMVTAHRQDPNRRGFILNMSSMSAWMAMPGIQCYNATKSYVLNFSRSLWHELHPEQIHVLAVTPGSTDTGLLPFGKTFAKWLRAVHITMPPERLVRRALHVLFLTSRKRCMPGAWNYIIVPIINHLPDWVIKIAMPKLI